MIIGINEYNSSYNGEIVQKQNELQAAEGEKSLFDSEKSGTESNKALAESDIVQLSTSVSDAQNNVSAALSDVSAAQSALSDAQNIPGEQKTNEDGTVTIDYSKREAAIAQAQAALEQAQAALEQAQQELNKNQAALESKTSETESLQAQIDTIQGQIDSVQSEIDSLNTEIAELEQQEQVPPQEIDISSYTQEREIINAQDAELREMYDNGDEEGVKAFFDELYPDNPLMAQAKLAEYTQEQEFFKEINYLTRWQNEDFSNLMNSLSFEEQDEFYEVMEKNSNSPINKGVFSPDEFNTYMQDKFIEFYGEELGEKQFKTYQDKGYDIKKVQSIYQRETINSQLNDTQLNEQAVFNDIDENIDLNKIKDASSVEEVLDILESYTNKEGAKLIFNGICADESFIQATGIQSMYINEEGNLIVNGEETDISQTPNPLKDKKDVVKNALFDFRNGEYVVSESVLAQLNNKSVKYDAQGNMLSSKEYFVDNEGNLSYVDVKYNYDKQGNPSGFSKTGYNASGNISYTDEYVFETKEDGEPSYSFIRKDAQGNTVSEYEDVSQDKISELNDLYAKAGKYTSRIDLSYDELLQIDTIDYLSSKNSDVEEILMNQDYEDGIISKAYNKGKELFGSSLSRQNVYEQMVQNVDSTNALIQAINNPDVSFEEAFKSIYGVDYNQEAVDAVRIAEGGIQIYASNAEQINQNDVLLSQAYQDGDFELLERMFDTIYSDNPDKAHEAYQQYLDEQSFLKEVDYLERWQSQYCQYGALMLSLSSEEEAAELEAAKNNNPDLPIGRGTVTKDEYDAYMQNKFIEFYGEEVGKEKYAQFTSSYPGNIQNVTSSYRDQAAQNLKNNLAALGFNTDNISEEYSKLNEQAFGTNQSIDLTDLVTEYVQDQQQFVDKASSAIQTAGMVLMVGGAIVAIPLSAGTSASALPYLMAAKTAMTAGRYVAMIGTFGGDALHLVDELTSQNCSDSDLNYILKDAAIDAAMHISGRLIGKISNGTHDFINQHTESLDSITKGIIGYGTEIAVDAPLSLLADYAITGDISLTSEGRSQLISLITGIAGERINNIEMKIAGATASTAIRPASDSNKTSDGDNVKPVDGDYKAASQTPADGEIKIEEDPAPKARAQQETDNPQTEKTETLSTEETDTVKPIEGDKLPEGEKPVEAIDPLHPKLPDEQTINQRIADLQNIQGINDPYGVMKIAVQKVAQLNDVQYSKAIEYMTKHHGDLIAAYKASQLDDAQYSRALDCIYKQGMTPGDAAKLAQLNDAQYSKALDCIDKQGMTPGDAAKLAQLDDAQYSRALDCIIQHNIKPDDAAQLAQLDDVQYTRALDLVDKKIPVSMIKDLVSDKDIYDRTVNLVSIGISTFKIKDIASDETIYKRALDLADKKIPAYNIAKIAADETTYKRALECIDHKINPDNISDFIQLDDLQYTRALDLFDKKIPAYQIKNIVSDESLYKRTSDLLDRNISPKKVNEIASDQQKYNRAIELSSKGLTGNSVTTMVLSDETQYAQYEATFSKVLDQLADQEGYSIELKILQNSEGFQFVARKMVDSLDGGDYRTGKIITFDENASIIQRSTVIRENDERSAYNLGSDRVTITSKINDDRDIASQIEIVNDENGEPSYILHTKESESLSGAYETVRYDLKDYPEDMDVLEAIKTGTITGGRTLSSVTSENGVTRYQEDYDYEGSTIKRDYSQSTDETGKVKSQRYQYTITDPNGNQILSVNRSWSANDDNTTTTTINGRTYTASFDDADLKITVTQDDGSSTTIDIGSKLAPYDPNDPYQSTFGSQEAMQKAFFESLKSAPADSLLTLGSDNIKTIQITDDLDSSINSGRGILKIGLNPRTLAHELGHGIDFNGKAIGHKKPGEISGNPDLIRIYNEECASFTSQYTDPNQAIIHYFSQTGGSGSTGLSELVAETNMLMTTYGQDANSIKTRSEYLVRYFPRTIAKVAELLGYNV